MLVTTPNTLDETTAQQCVVTGGADTHKHVHVIAALDHLGRILGTLQISADPQGYDLAFKWLSGFGPITAIGIEGTGSYGAGLSRFLRAAHIKVIDVQCPNRQHRRRNGKSDCQDAIAAAKAVQSGEANTTAKTADSNIEMIRMLNIGRRSAVNTKTQLANQIHALIDTSPNLIREELKHLTVKQVTHKTVGRKLPETPTSPDDAFWQSLASLSRRWQHQHTEIDTLTRQIRQLVKKVAPNLLAEFGIGPVAAADLLCCVGDNHDRIKSEAAFAAICGTSPVDASSGRNQRHRLNRGGDRQANNALWHIAQKRIRYNYANTTQYVERKKSEGKTNKEILRCLKRHIARHAYRIIKADLQQTKTNQQNRQNTQNAT